MYRRLRCLSHKYRRRLTHQMEIRIAVMGYKTMADLFRKMKLPDLVGKASLTCDALFEEAKIAIGLERGRRRRVPQRQRQRQLHQATPAHSSCEHQHQRVRPDVGDPQGLGAWRPRRCHQLPGARGGLGRRAGRAQAGGATGNLRRLRGPLEQDGRPEAPGLPLGGGRQPGVRDSRLPRTGERHSVFQREPPPGRAPRLRGGRVQARRTGEGRNASAPSSTTPTAASWPPTPAA